MITLLAGIPHTRGWLDRVQDTSHHCASTAVQNLGGKFLLAARRHGDRLAFISASQSFTFDSLAGAAVRVAEHLGKLPGFAAGDRVALLMSNSPYYLAAFYGTLLAGGVVVPLPVQLDAARLQLVRAQSDAKVLLTCDADLRRRDDLSNESVTRVDLSAGISPSTCLRVDYHLASAETLAMLLYTSGSTGQPKGVMLSHGNLISNADSIPTFLPIQPQDRTLALLPFCHAYGNSILQTHVLAGATLVVDGSATFPNTIVDALERHGITSFSGVPELYHALLSCSDLGRRPLPQLRYMTVAGGALDQDTSLRVSELISPSRFFVMYGQTEATARLAYLPEQELRRRPNSIGKAIVNVELQIQDDDGREVECGQTGELCARGPNIMLGYWRNSEATAHTLQNGWLRTGDLATADNDGFFYLVGRKKEQVKIRGINVAPRQVANSISGQFPSCHVVVIPYTTNSTTRLALFLAPLNGAPPSLSLVRQVCRATLPRHEVPNHIAIIDQVPLTPSLKVDLKSLSNQLENQRSSLTSVSMTRTSGVSLTAAEQR